MPALLTRTGPAACAVACNDAFEVGEPCADSATGSPSQPLQDDTLRTPNARTAACGRTLGAHINRSPFRPGLATRLIACKRTAPIKNDAERRPRLPIFSDQGGRRT